MSTSKNFEDDCLDVIKRYSYDIETAHIQEDRIVYNALYEVVNQINQVNNEEELSLLKNESKKILESITKMIDKTRNIKWYA